MYYRLNVNEKFCTSPMETSIRFAGGVTTVVNDVPVIRGDETIYVLSPTDSIVKCIRAMNMDNIKTRFPLNPEDRWVVRSGLDSRFALIRTYLTGYADEGDYTGINLCPVLLFDAINDLAFFDKLWCTDKNSLEIAIVREVDLHNETRKEIRLLMAYRIAQDINILHKIVDEYDLDGAFSIKFHEMETIYPNVSIFLMENKDTIPDLAKVKPNIERLRESYAKYMSRNYNKSAILQAMSLNYNFPQLEHISDILRIQNPQTTSENMWNTLCLFRSFLTVDEYEYEMNFMYDILHRNEGANPDNPQSYIDIINKTWTDCVFECAPTGNKYEDTLYNMLKSSFKNNPFQQTNNRQAPLVKEIEQEDEPVMVEASDATDS